MSQLLVVTAVAAEADAVLTGRAAAPGQVAGLPVRRFQSPAGLVDVLVGGAGPVAAAVSATAVLSGGNYDLVLSTGIAGGFDGTALAVADCVVFADLGAQSADGGFCSITELGFGNSEIRTDAALTAALAERTGARRGTMLTVATVTGTAARADQLRAAHPDAVAEGMEGFAVAAAAGRIGVRFAELRAVSNPVGPRDRNNWQLGPALARLSAAFDAVLAEGAL